MGEGCGAHAAERGAAPHGAGPLVGVVTVSDRASTGEYEDRSGPAVEAALRERIAGECRFERLVVPDDRFQVAVAIRAFADRGASLVCTSGGTGPAPRDVTPEAMEQACDKLLPGFGEAMRLASLKEGVPTAILSRQTAGVAARTLVVNLPGSPKAIACCLDAVFAAVPDCLDLIGAPSFEPNPERVQVYRRHRGKGTDAHAGCDHG